MSRSSTPVAIGWVFAILFHEVILLVLLVGSEEFTTIAVRPDFTVNPAAHSVIVRQGPVRRLEPLLGGAGRWPMNCEHGVLLRRVRTSPNEVLADTRCEVCGWPWWVVRAASWD